MYITPEGESNELSVTQKIGDRVGVDRSKRLCICGTPTAKCEFREANLLTSSFASGKREGPLGYDTYLRKRSLLPPY